MFLWCHVNCGSQKEHPNELKNDFPKSIKCVPRKIHFCSKKKLWNLHKSKKNSEYIAFLIILRSHKIFAKYVQKGVPERVFLGPFSWILYPNVEVILIKKLNFPLVYWGFDEIHYGNPRCHNWVKYVRFGACFGVLFGSFLVSFQDSKLTNHQFHLVNWRILTRSKSFEN